MRHAAFKKKFKFELAQKLKFTQKFKQKLSQEPLLEQEQPQFPQQQELFRRVAYFRKLREDKDRNSAEETAHQPASRLRRVDRGPLASIFETRLSVLPFKMVRRVHRHAV